MNDFHEILSDKYSPLNMSGNVLLQQIQPQVPQGFYGQPPQQGAPGQPTTPPPPVVWDERTRSWVIATPQQPTVPPYQGVGMSDPRLRQDPRSGNWYIPQDAPPLYGQQPQQVRDPRSGLFVTPDVLTRPIQNPTTGQWFPAVMPPQAQQQHQPRPWEIHGASARPPQQVRDPRSGLMVTPDVLTRPIQNPTTGQWFLPVTQEQMQQAAPQAPQQVRDPRSGLMVSPDVLTRPIQNPTTGQWFLPVTQEQMQQPAPQAMQQQQFVNPWAAKPDQLVRDPRSGLMVAPVVLTRPIQNPTTKEWFPAVDPSKPAEPRPSPQPAARPAPPPLAIKSKHGAVPFQIGLKDQLAFCYDDINPVAALRAIPLFDDILTTISQQPNVTTLHPTLKTVQNMADAMLADTTTDKVIKLYITKVMMLNPLTVELILQLARLVMHAKYMLKLTAPASIESGVRSVIMAMAVEWGWSKNMDIGNTEEEFNASVAKMTWLYGMVGGFFSISSFPINWNPEALEKRYAMYAPIYGSLHPTITLAAQPAPAKPAAPAENAWGLRPPRFRDDPKPESDNIWDRPILTETNVRPHTAPSAGANSWDTPLPAQQPSPSAGANSWDTPHPAQQRPQAAAQPAAAQSERSYNQQRFFDGPSLCSQVGWEGMEIYFEETLREQYGLPSMYGKRVPPPKKAAPIVPTGPKIKEFSDDTPWYEVSSYQSAHPNEIVRYAESPKATAHQCRDEEPATYSNAAPVLSNQRPPARERIVFDPNAPGYIQAPKW